MADPYVVITRVENGFTITVCGVPCPQSFVAYSADQATERIAQILPQLQSVKTIRMSIFASQPECPEESGSALVSVKYTPEEEA